MSKFKDLLTGMGFAEVSPEEMKYIVLRCPFCEERIKPDDEKCPNCERILPRCPKCNNILIDFDECIFCGAEPWRYEK